MVQNSGQLYVRLLFHKEFGELRIGKSGLTESYDPDTLTKWKLLEIKYKITIWLTLRHILRQRLSVSFNVYTYYTQGRIGLDLVNPAHHFRCYGNIDSFFRDRNSDVHERKHTKTRYSQNNARCQKPLCTSQNIFLKSNKLDTLEAYLF